MNDYSTFSNKAVANSDLNIVEVPQSYLFFKRTIDIVGAFFGVIFLFWLFALVAILIKIEDPKGPVFFKR